MAAVGLAPHSDCYRRELPYPKIPATRAIGHKPPRSSMLSAMEIERLAHSEWVRLKHIRLISLRDAPEAFGTTLEIAQGWADDVWRQQAKDLATFVAVIDGADLGIARGAMDESDAHLISMWVSSNARGRGVGEQLVAAVSQWARDAKFNRLLLDVSDNNRFAVALYERLNFLPTGESSVYPPPRSHITEHRRMLLL